MTSREEGHQGGEELMELSITRLGIAGMGDLLEKKGEQGEKNSRMKGAQT